MTESKQSKSGNVDFDTRMQLNRDTYTKDYLPVYKARGITPRKLIQFPIILPFHMPFDDGMCITFMLENNTACTLSFDTLTTVQGVHAGIIGDKAIEISLHRTRVEMTYVIGTENDISLDEKVISQYFDDMISRLNSVIVSYLIIVKDPTVYRVTKEMLEFGSIYRIIDPNNWSKYTTGLFLLHFQTPWEKPNIGRDLQEKVAWYTHVVDKELNPFTLAEELSQSAVRELANGSFSQAVVFAQTAVEAFLSIALKQLMLEEGMSDEEIDLYLQNSNYIARLKKDYHPRIGGQWNIDTKDSVIGRLNEFTYLLRNRIVHGGYIPGNTESSLAIESQRELIRYTVSLISA